MHQKVQALVGGFKVTAINPQLGSIFGSMIIFDPRSRVIEILESGSIPFKKQNIIPASTGVISQKANLASGSRQRKSFKEKQGRNYYRSKKTNNNI